MIDYLKDAIVEYVQKADRPDSINIVSHFKLPVNVTYTKIKELEEEGRIIRTNLDNLGGWNGNHYYE